MSRSRIVDRRDLGLALEVQKTIRGNDSIGNPRCILKETMVGRRVYFEQPLIDRRGERKDKAEFFRSMK